MLEELQEVHGTEYKLKIHQRARGQAPLGLKEHFPLGKSPILTIEEDGKPSTKVYQLPQHPGTLTESRLCLQFLSDTFSKGTWEPETPEDKAQDIFLQEFANSTFADKATKALIFEIIPAQLPWGLSHLLRLMFSPIVQHWKNDMEPIYQVMEETLSEERPWFSGKKIGLADFNMIWGMDLSEHRKYIDEAKYPRCQAWYQRITGRAAYKRACEKGGMYNLATFV